MTKKQPASEPPVEDGRQPFEKFTEFAQRIVAVPKGELKKSAKAKKNRSAASR